MVIGGVRERIAGTLDNLLKPENNEKLAGILTCQVLTGKVMAGDVKTCLLVLNLL